MATGLATLHGFGPYRLMGVLGEGQVCTVYRAVRDPDGAVGAEVALAIVHPVGAADAEAAHAFMDRADSAVGFHHRNVAAVLEAGKLEGRAFAVRERVDGFSLAELLPKRGKGLKPADAYAVVTALLDSLVAAQTFCAGLVHGRLDLGAILIDSDGCVRVSGFGRSDAPAETDLLEVSRLALAICGTWPSEVHTWIDRVADQFQTPQEAYEALAAIGVEGGDKAARSLARRVKRRVKQLEPKDGGNVATTDTKAGPAPQTEDVGSSNAASLGANPNAVRGRKAERRKVADRRDSERRQPAPHADLGAATNEARWVAGICAVAVLAALVIEITRHVS